jgi:hypothetical protein
MKRRKEQVNATISPLSARQLEAFVGSDTLFSSRSDVIDKAIGMLFSALNSASLCDCAAQYGLSLHGNMAGRAVMQA